MGLLNSTKGKLAYFSGCVLTSVVLLPDLYHQLGLMSFIIITLILALCFMVLTFLL